MFNLLSRILEHRCNKKMDSLLQLNMWERVYMVTEIL